MLVHELDEENRAANLDARHPFSARIARSLCPPVVHSFGDFRSYHRPFICSVLVQDISLGFGYSVEEVAWF